MACLGLFIRDNSFLHRPACLKITLKWFIWTQNYSKLMLHYLIRVDSYEAKILKIIKGR